MVTWLRPARIAMGLASLGAPVRSLLTDMRSSRLPWGILLSLLGHAALIAALVVRKPASRPEPLAPAEPPWLELVAVDLHEQPRLPEPLPAPPPQPVLVPDHAPAQIARPARSAPPADAEALAGTGAASPPAAPPGDVAQDPSLLSMRSQPKTAASDSDQPAGGGPNLSPAQVARALEPEPGPLQRSPLELPGAGVPRPPRSEIVPDGRGAYQADDLTFHAAIDRDGRVRLDDKPDFTFGGKMDVTSWAMRKAGEDPYLRRKIEFIERTRAQRADMAARNHEEVTRDAIAGLSAHLAALWAHGSWSAAERRRALFELWDECVETGPDAEAGRAARATVMAFIRRRLPQGSAHGFTAAELAELNRGRVSTETFAPYR